MASGLIKNSQNKRSQQAKLRRKQRIRAKTQGSSARPRLSFFKSSQHIYVQAIDDTRSHTLLALSSFNSKSAAKSSASSTIIPQSPRAGIEQCSLLGKQMAALCLDAGITEVVFDRNGLPFHGRIKAFAEAARAAGLKF